MLSRWLVGALLLGLALNVAISGVDALVTLRHPGLLDPDVELASPGELAVALGLLLAGLAAVFVFISCAVMFCVWIYRANRNAHASHSSAVPCTMGLEAMSTSVTAAVGGPSGARCCRGRPAPGPEIGDDPAQMALA